MGVIDDFSAWRRRRTERNAWAATVRHLRAAGTKAFVPAYVAAELHKTGVPWDWYYVNPCGQHGGECMTAVPDDAETGEPFHLPVRPQSPLPIHRLTRGSKRLRLRGGQAGAPAAIIAVSWFPIAGLARGGELSA